jgi:hypothetical protein
MIRTKSCRCVMLRVTSLWIRLTLLEITSLWTYTLSYLPPPLEHTHRIRLFPLIYNSDRTYIPNNVISLGLQTLNPQHNFFPLKAQTSDYHYRETSKRHTDLCRNSVTSTKHDKNDHILHETRVEILSVELIIAI